MGNTLYIKSTKFEDRDGSVTFGFRMYDNDGMSYRTGFDEFLTDAELIQEAFKGLSSQEGLLEDDFEFTKGAEVNGTYYTYDEINTLITQANAQEIPENTP